MAVAIEDNIIRANKKKLITYEKAKETVKQTTEYFIDKTNDGVHFLIMWTAVGWYYFFAGLYMVLYKKLPKGWTRLEKKDVVMVMGNFKEYLPNRVQQRKYGKVVNLDDLPPTNDLLKS